MNRPAFRRRCLKIVVELLQNPTAPLHEGMVQSYLREFVRRRPTLTLRQDQAGNMVISYASGKKIRNHPLIMVAHMDHPGFWVEEVSAHIVKLSFKGGVSKPHAQAGMKVRFFENNRREPIGSGKLISVQYNKDRFVSATARIIVGKVRAGNIGMWDLPAVKIQNGLIISRACDDLLGMASALCTLDEIARRKPAGVIIQGLFTRAEEMGCLGALEAIRLRTVPKNAVVLSLETSKALENAPQGAGVILRVGDRASIFSPDLTGALWQVAGQLALKDRTFKCQRKLMDGGVCEATIFCSTGYRASGLALPLGNYHNQSFSPKHRAEIGPETVSVNDFICQVKLLVEAALQPKLLKKQSPQPAWLKKPMQIARQVLGEKTPAAMLKE
jgi:putative aminopeptidase FrvX